MEFPAQDKRYRAAVYIRLSKDDGGGMESNSVANQRALIASFLRSRPEIEVRSERVDDGYSGVTFDRPAVKALFSDIKAGLIDCVVVKDLSRFGRNYIETGRYLEQIFPFLGVRFIAVVDGFDSAREQGQADGLLLPFKNLLNDAYSRDLSMKIRSQLKVRCLRGDYIGAFPAYGYIRSRTQNQRLEIDEPAAMTVRDIFRWKIEGHNNRWIAERLNALGILSPLEYKRMSGWAFSTSFQRKPAAEWSAQTVARILHNEIYAGTMVQGKESTPNYKVKKKFPCPRSEWIRVEGTHEGIVSGQDFALVARLMASDTRTAPGQGELYLFSGLLRCGCCGRSMIRRPVRSNGKTYAYYVCRTQKTDRARCGGSRISEDRLANSVKEILRLQIALLHTAIQERDGRAVEERDRPAVEAESRQTATERDGRAAKTGSGQEEEAGSRREECGSSREEGFRRQPGVLRLNRPLLVALIDQIAVTDQRRIRLHFRFRDEFAGSAGRAADGKSES
ncbi:MAG: recombinase family protein [Clostridium sp.]|jgi:DNA invertase Pin-like site-specific DNA recombinase|nr:recombinase family protein [Clostridium sp.]